jgi:hypothetical protein
MKTEINLDKLRELLNKGVSDLRASRLWPLAIVLLVAIVAVPIVLAKSSSPAPATGVPQSTPPVAPGAAVAALNVQSSAGRSRLPGKGRNPFGDQASPGASNASGAATTTSGSGASGTGQTGSSSGGAGASSGSTSTASTSTPSAPPTSTPTSPPSITPNTKPTPAPRGLAADQSYHVTLAITNPSGGLDTIDPLGRLSVLPSTQQPRLVELGVLHGGNRVLFLVQPGTVVGGPGTCTPGPIDCEILSIGQDQTESISVASAGGSTQIALFAIAGITVDRHSSAAGAMATRRSESAAGRSLLNRSTLPALSLFRYDPSVGAVVDLRNLTAGDVR